jgi:hypothetical protein
MDDAPSYHGEIWTDALGVATVHVPLDAGELEYELCDLDPPGTARITAELQNGRFTIATDQPHVKVGWRVTHAKRGEVR